MTKVVLFRSMQGQTPYQRKKELEKKVRDQDEEIVKGNREIDGLRYNRSQIIYYLNKEDAVGKKV